MPKPTRFGPQPIREVVWRRGITHADFAAQMNIRPMSHVRHAMAGVCPPSEELRQRASYVLNVPVRDLFTQESLAAIRQPGRVKGPKPRAVGAP